jgi:predicted metal-dependent hydrolase
MAKQLQLGGIVVDVVLKDIKNVHLSVYPPAGRVRISAPSRMNLDTIRVFAIAKLDWIRRQQGKLREQKREMPREYLDRESHYIWGKRYLLTVIEHDQPAAVALKHNRMVLTVRSGTGEAAKEAAVAQWYRDQIKAATLELIAKWEPLLGVGVKRVFVQQMKTMWGSCNPRRRTIRLNTELSKKPKECLEYIVVHEMVHLLEPTHNARFVALMDQFMPKWKFLRQRLNRLPIRRADWEY